MQHMYITSRSAQRITRHDIPIAILPAVDKPPLSQNRGHEGKEGTPHKPLLPVRLKRDIISH